MRTPVDNAYPIPSATLSGNQNAEPAQPNGPPSESRIDGSDSVPELHTLFRDLKLGVEYLPIAELRRYGRNPRKHSKRQLSKIAESIRAFGLLPLIADEKLELISGHGVLEAAKSLGYTEVPVIRVGHLGEPEKRALRLALNRLPELADWDRELLALEFKDLLEFDLNLDLSFALEITGFESAEIDQLIETRPAITSPDPDDLIPEADEIGPPVSQVGDLWLLGDHRLFCGDARDPAAYASLLGGERAAMVFSDPPYNVPVSGHVSGLGRTKHREFACASGEMSDAEFTAFLTDVFRSLTSVSTEGSIHMHCMDWRGISAMMTAGNSVYSELKNLCVWAKDNGGMGSLYRSRHELIFVWKHGTERHANNVQLGKFGRNRTNVWEYPGVNTFRSGREDELAMHPTVKPTALVADAIRDCSNRNDVILDAFSGSGTTIIASAKTGRRGYALELDPRYVDVAIKRWEAWSGETTRHAATGLSFAQLQEQRRSTGDVGPAHVSTTDSTSGVPGTGAEPERPIQSVRIRQRARAA
jgi:hypothetical protein